MLYNILPDSSNLLFMLNCFLSFALTAVLLAVFKPMLPQDNGRAYAVNGALSKGKARGAGIILVLVLVACSLLFVPVISAEYPVYYACLVAAMLTGFFDDASKAPWSEYLKGALDLVIALVLVFTFLRYNTPVMNLMLLEEYIELPYWLFAILAVILVWVSINVVNCTDGVDGLCASLSIVTFAGFVFIIRLCTVEGQLWTFAQLPVSFIMILLGYLLFNSSPSTVLMGDAGSRAIGLFLALLALKTDVLLFIPFAIVFILDGGLGLIKVSLLRFLKISILKKIRTPLHDHFRKNVGWSDTQTVFRFVVIQAAIILVISALAWI